MISNRDASSLMTDSDSCLEVKAVSTSSTLVVMYERSDPFVRLIRAPVGLGAFESGTISLHSGDDF